MKVSVGAGKYREEGWWTCDIQEHPKAPRPLDARCDAKSIPLPDECADVVQAIHLWEHFYRWDCDVVIVEWRRILKRGGLLVLELPNLYKACANIISGKMRGGKHPDQLSMWAIYGDDRSADPFMMHKYGWTPARLTEFLAANGFVKIVERPTQFHPAGREHRDMRIEARKA